MFNVSIIIPVYGVEKYIKRCLDSVVNQTLKNIEIIIVNDETTDNSMLICEEYAKKDSRINIYNKKNEGLGLTRNYGIEKAHGEYIAFLDSDDFVDLDFYEKLYNNAKKNGSEVCFTNYKRFYDKDNIIHSPGGNIPFEEETIDAKRLLLNMMKAEAQNGRFIGMSVWRSIYKKSIVEQYNIKFCSERIFISEDIIFNFDYLIHAKKVSFIRDTYYYYCLNSSSLTQTYRKDRFEKNKILNEELLRKVKEISESKLYESGIANMYIDNIRGCIKNEFYHNKYKIACNNVKVILNDITVQNALNKKSKDNCRKDIFDYIMRKKYIKVLYYFCKIRKKLKK